MTGRGSHPVAAPRYILLIIMKKKQLNKSITN